MANPFMLLARVTLGALLVSSAARVHATPGELAPMSNLITASIPPVPQSLAQEVKRYNESRAAGFAGWHPKKVEMLITTRFGNTNQIHSVVQPMGMRRQLTFFDEPVGSAGFEPINGDFILFTRDQGGSEFGQIYRYDVKDGAITRLTDGKRSQNGNVGFTHKGDRIAYASTQRNGADRDIYIMDPRDPKTNHLVLQVQGGGWGLTDWSPDDKTLLIQEEISVNESHLYLFDVAAGQKSELTSRSESGVAYDHAAFSKDGKGVYLTSDKDFEFQRLGYMDLATKQVAYLTSDIHHDVSGFSLSYDGRSLLFIVNEDGPSRLYMMDTATRRYHPVAGMPAGYIAGASWHKDNRHVAITLTNARSPLDVYVLDVTDGRITRWTESELGGVMASELNMDELIHWKSFDGLELSGLYLKPAAKFTGRRPVIINIHGGPEAQSRPYFQGRNNYLLNELGVAMIYPNVRGSTGYGKTFVAMDNGKKREDSVKDIGALLDWIAQQPDLDPDRVMITGGSYGGFMTLACAVKYNDRIRCSVDVVGISNFVTFLQNTESYRRDLRRVEYGDERDPDMRAFLQEISPRTHADKITKPIFIIQGANDPRVPRTESMEMADTIRKNGGTVWYLEAKDEGHGFKKKSNADFQFYATILFIQQNLLGRK